MKTGAWIEATTGRWHWIDDHADWIRRPECARRAGLPEEVVLRLAAMPRRAACGPERTAIILEAMRHGLIRFRGHGTEVTFESTLPLEVVIPAVSRFMAEQFGPMTWSASTGSRMAPALASPTRISFALWKRVTCPALMIQQGQLPEILLSRKETDE